MPGTFITCWLQDPGSLPPGDGPPGGGGGGGGGWDDDDDDECNGKVTYYSCAPPLDLNWDEDCNCNVPFEVDEDCVNGNDDCIAWEGQIACQDACDEKCEHFCTGDEIMCRGWRCQGGPGFCDQVDLASDYNLFTSNACGKGRQFGCEDIIWPCLGAYKDPQSCIAADFAGDQLCTGGAECPGYICKDKECDPLAEGDCDGTMVGDWECPNFFNILKECISSPGLTCQVGGETVYSDKPSCDATCKEELTCQAWKCTRLEGGSYHLCTEVTLKGDNCDIAPEGCPNGIYNGSKADHYLTKDACDTACAGCPDGYLCIMPIEDRETIVIGGPDLNCEPSISCEKHMVNGACILKPLAPPTCYETQAECILAGEECDPSTREGGPGEEDVVEEVEEPVDDGYALYGGKTAYEKIYGVDGNTDPVYQKYVNNTKFENSRTFVGVPRGNLRGDLFKDIVHVGIKATVDIINKQIRFSDRPFTDLNTKNLVKSIHDSIIERLNKAKDSTGRTITKEFIRTVRNLIVLNKVDTLDITDWLHVADRMVDVDAQRVRVGYNQDEVEVTKILTTRTGTIANEAAAIQLATESIWPLKFDNYTEVRVAERIRTWKTLAPDLEKGLPITTSDGTTTILYYDIKDTIVLDGDGTLVMSNGDLQRVTLSDGGIAEIPVKSLIDRAGILSLEVLQKLMYILGDEYDFTMKVTTDASSRVDEKYGISNKRKDFYMFTLQDVEDMPRDNPFIRKSKATYKYETDVDARNAWVNTEGSGAAFPYLEFYFNAEDPIASYWQNDGTIEVISKDFVLDLFDEASYDNGGLPIIPRRGPVQTIVAYPSDRTENILTHAISKSVGYGMRELKIVLDYNPDKLDTWDPIFLKERLAYPGRGINPTVENTQAVQYSMNTKSIADNNLYNEGEPTLPRPAFGVREVYRLAKAMKDDYVIPSNNTINWYEVYDRMEIPMMKYLHRECRNFNEFSSALSVGKPSSDESVNKLYPRLKNYRSQNWLGNNDDKSSVYENIVWLKAKIDHTPIEPTPLD